MMILLAGRYKDVIRMAMAAAIGAIGVLLAACGGDDGQPRPTPVPANEVSLVYTTFQSNSSDENDTTSRIYEVQAGSTARLIGEYTPAAIVFMLASPDGRMVAFVDNGEMKIIDRTTGGNVMTLGRPPISTTGAGPFASWAPDSRLFAYSRVNYTRTPIADIPNSVRSGWIEVIDVASKEVVTPAWTKAVPVAQPFWSPVGDEFVTIDFGNAGDTNRPLVVGGMDKRHRMLTNEPPGNKGMPVWSTDGRHIAYWVLEKVLDKKGNTVPGAIYIVDADGENAHFLVQASFLSPQAWSPDGKRLAVSCPPEGKTLADKIQHICLVDVGSGKSTDLTSGLFDYSAAFSPDGDTVAYLSDPDPNTGTSTLKTIRVSDKHTETIATDVPFGGMTWARIPAAP